jgi:proteasome lid subunit RPN8/RPN11
MVEGSGLRHDPILRAAESPRKFGIADRRRIRYSPAVLEFSDEIVGQIRNQAFDGYPSECCGLLFAGSGTESVTRCAPLENIADRYHALDPVEYPRTSRDAFMVNEAKLDRIVREAEDRGEKWIGFYHSHIDCGAYFSDEDKRFAAPGGEPVYPHLIQVVIETHADRVAEARAFRWNGREFVHDGTFPEFAGEKNI